MYIVFIVLGVLPTLITVRVIQLAFDSTLRDLGIAQPQKEEVLPAMRGAILDQAGRMLAVNAASYVVAVDPTQDGFSRNAEALYRRLSQITGRSAASYRNLVKNRKSRQYAMLARGLTESQKNRIENWGDDPARWLVFETRFARRYTYRATASHLLGHVNVDFTGLDGLEKQADEVLRGINGSRLLQVDRRRRVSANVGAPVREPQHGDNIVLTIDLVRQAMMEEELKQAVEESRANWGTALAMNPQTGAILAMANYPTYDPNNANSVSVEARRNHAVADQMELGSVMKMVTAVALIDQGLMAMTDTLQTGNGYWKGLRDTHGYGRISLSTAISKSSNIGLAKAGLRLDEGTFYQYFRNFGFGQATGIELPAEQTGTLRNPNQWDRNQLTQRQMSIGYAIDVTPLQLLVAYGAFANGGLLMQPFIIAEHRDMYGQTIWAAQPDSIRRVFKKETRQILLPSFEDVITDGTAKTARIDSLRIAGKTGTAQKAVNGRYVPGKYRGSFIGFFPAEKPEVVMLVVMDEPHNGFYGGTVAAPVFQRIAKRWIGTFPKIASKMAPAEPLPVVPSVEEKPVRVAALTTSEDEGKLPDFVGLSSREAVAWLTARGIKVQLQGRGRIKKQYPAAGRPVSNRVVLTGWQD